jgi:hypothetical protein
MKSHRSLYDCFYARVQSPVIYCAVGHALWYAGRPLTLERLAQGDPLIMGVCQNCKDFLKMGEPLDPAERGWERKEKGVRL